MLSLDLAHVLPHAVSASLIIVVAVFVVRDLRGSARRAPVIWGYVALTVGALAGVASLASTGSALAGVPILAWCIAVLWLDWARVLSGGRSNRRRLLTAWRFLALEAERLASIRAEGHELGQRLNGMRVPSRGDGASRAEFVRLHQRLKTLQDLDWRGRGKIAQALWSLDRLREPGTEELIELIQESYWHLVRGIDPDRLRHAEVEARMSELEAELIATIRQVSK
jgi:hypothetical protein